MPQCKDCGKKISKKATRCNPCASKKREEAPAYRTRKSETAKRLWEDPEFRAKMVKRNERTSERLRQLWENPEYRTMMTEQPKTRWENPEFRTKMSKVTRQLWEDPKHRTMMSKIRKQQWGDSKYRAMMSEKAKQQWENSEFRAMKSEHVSEQLKRQWEDSEYRTKMSEMSKQQWENPEYRAMQSEKSSEWLNQQWKDPEYRATMSGENHWNWKDGISTEPYGLDWTEELKEEIRERDNYTCAISGEVWQPDQPTFHVHHIDADKKNCDRDNLITLTPSNHAKANANRRHWQPLLAHIAKGAEMQANAFVKLGDATL